MLRLFVCCYMMLAFSSFSATAKKALTAPPKKIIVIHVSPSGNALIGRDRISIDNLSKELQNRLWKSFLGTGKMQDSIQLKFDGEVLMGVRSAAMDALREGQQLALKDICLQQHKMLFEELNEKQQQKIRKHFPILFQSDYL